MKYLSNSRSRTREIAKKIAERVLKDKKHQAGKAMVFGLVGDLGSGKTTFVQAFLRSLGVRGRITSPTFVFVKGYVLKENKGGYKKAYHIDAYRVQKPKDLLRVGFGEAIHDSRHIVLIEWADQIKKVMPKNTKWIKFEHMRGNKRNILLKKIKS